ncbi:AraC family transcriptional regulator [Acinetobacter sp. ANC 4648]|uniref:AraC family transcriptional regulator n=1 Tax=Acinetobacter sp. ANC 4648 TaxID=1977875 RepID=UPI000A352CC6|nr:helix-turn-helix transcriptional regulator [Acinetobacter sp. ANC 4648]OTG82260.1 AraC family transcriptional regulator [Acinetobacter sp. ANC 4648]
MNESGESSPKLVISMGSQHSHGSIIAPHNHSRAQLLYASEGSIRVHTTDHIWIIPPYCALWIPAFLQHSVISFGQVRLSTALVEEKAALQLGSKCFLVRMTNLLRELVLRLNQIDLIEKNENPYDDDLEKALQLLIFNEIQQASTFPIEIPWPRDKRLILICQMLLDHPDDVKDLNTWADRVGTSSRTLIRLFQRDTGLSYRAWIQHMHIVLALSYLAQGESISRTANLLGYTNSSAFSAMFKRHLGNTPQNYRNNNAE